MSFSSDTGMAECLIIARKNVGANNYSPLHRVHFTSLLNRPGGFAQAAAVANGVITADDIRAIDDGPYGGTQLTVGDDLAGEMLTARQSDDGESWSSVRLQDYSLAQTAYALSQSKLWLPGEPTEFGTENGIAWRSGQTRPVSFGHQRAAAARSFRQGKPQPHGHLPLPVEPQCQQGNPHSLRTGFAVAGSERFGDKSGNGLVNRQRAPI